MRSITGNTLFRWLLKAFLYTKGLFTPEGCRKFPREGKAPFSSGRGINPSLVDDPTFLSEAKPMKAPKVRPYISLDWRARFQVPYPSSAVSACNKVRLILGSGMIPNAVDNQCFTPEGLRMLAGG